MPPPLVWSTSAAYRIVQLIVQFSSRLIGLGVFPHVAKEPVRGRAASETMRCPVETHAEKL